MAEAKQKYLIDSNSLVTPYKLYYAFDLVPSYWKEFLGFLESGEIILLDIVRDEIKAGKDDLAEWLNGISGAQICQHATKEIICKYQEVLQYVATCRMYRESALRAWAPEYIADPWLIAAASVHGYVIVTEEVKSGGLSPKTPNKSAKIPDVAEFFGVRTVNIYGMMRELGIRI